MDSREQDSRGISRASRSGPVALGLNHCLLLPIPSPMVSRWLLSDGFLSWGKGTDAKWMTADVFP